MISRLILGKGVVYQGWFENRSFVCMVTWILCQPLPLTDSLLFPWSCNSLLPLHSSPSCHVLFLLGIYWSNGRFFTPSQSNQTSIIALETPGPLHSYQWNRIFTTKLLCLTSSPWLYHLINFLNITYGIFIS